MALGGSPTFLSLFAGVGGFDLALERAGFRCVGQVEIEPFDQRVLAAQWPRVERWHDVRRFGAGLVGRATDDAESGGRESSVTPEHVDLLVGGFPCQDLSVAGKRAGLGGERSGLFWEIVRIAKVLRPTWGLFENVPGLLSSARGRDMGLVLAGLRECWPVVGYRVLDSRHFGVAQRRRRVFFVCGPDEERVAEVLALGEGGGGDSPQSDEARTRVAASLRAGAHGAGVNEPGRRAEDDVNLVLGSLGMNKERGGWRAGPDEAAANHLVVASGLSARYGKGTDSDATDTLVAQCHGSNVGPMGALRKGNGNTTGGVPFIAVPLTTTYGKTIDYAGTHGSGPDNLVVRALSAEGADASEDGTGRGTPIIPIQYAEQWGRDKRQNGVGIGKEGDPSFTLDASYPHGFGIGASVRRLTPVECERLQGFPDGWTCLCLPLEEYARDPEEAALRCRCPDSPRY